MDITEQTKFQLELDNQQLELIKDALSDSATKWILFSTEQEDSDLRRGGMINFHRVAAVRDLFNEHYNRVISEKS